MEDRRQLDTKFLSYYMYTERAKNKETRISVIQNTVLRLKCHSLEFQLTPRVGVGLLEVRRPYQGCVLATVSLGPRFFSLGPIPWNLQKKISLYRYTPP